MIKINSKIVAMYLSAIIMIAALAGCAYPATGLNKFQAPSQGGNAKIEEEASEEKDTDADGKPSKDTGANSDEEAPEGNGEVAGGSPWINSDIKANITEDMELSAKDDFNLFVNHDWLMSNEIPEGQPFYTSFHDATDQIEDNIVKFMENDTAESHEAELSRTFYHALLDWEARDKTGFGPAQGKIDAIKQITDIDELTSFLCDISKSCFVPSGIDVFNNTFFDDSSKYIVMIDDINQNLILSDPSEYKEKTEMGEAYYKATKELSESMLKRAGFSKDEADAVLEGAIAFEAKLAETVPTPAQINSPEYQKSVTNLYDIDSLKELFSAYPIGELLEGKGYGGAKQYQVTTPDYARRLGSLYNEENLEQIKDYMIVHFCISAAKMLDREAFEAYNRYKNTTYGSSGNMADTYYATQMTRTYLPDAMAKAYVEYYHLEKSKDKIKKLCGEIIDIYEDMLNEEEWLSEEMKEKAVEKLKYMTVNSVYPDKWIDYDSLRLDGDSLYGYFEQIEIFNEKHDASHTDQAVDKEEWDLRHYDMDPLITNAGYAPGMNSIYIFAGIAIDPLYRDDMSDEEFFGGLGQVIGHEISHAFDPVGSQYDKDGNLKNWWTKEDQEAFDERAEKLVKYYDGITIWTGLNASGELDQTEVIADMGSMNALLRLAKNKQDFDYEAFFKAYAKAWRCLSSREIDYELATQDPHPVYYLRTNVTLQQFEEFYEIFGVEEGDGMYLAPEDRVAVW